MLKTGYRSLAASALLVLLLSPGTGAAQNAPAAPAGGPPPLWWLQNAATVRPVMDRLLVHAEVQYAFTRMRGNLNGTQHTGGGLVVLRKGLLSSGTSGNIQKQDATIQGDRGSIKQTSWMFEQNVRYDVNAWIGPQAGVILEHDDTRFIDSRRTYYGGVNIYPVTTPRVQARVLFAGGHQTEEFTVAEPTRDAWHGYLGSEAHVTVSPQVRLYENSSYLFEAGDMDNNLWRVSVGADISLNRWFGVSLSWNVNYDAQPVPSTTEKKDTQQMIMFRIAY